MVRRRAFILGAGATVAAAGVGAAVGVSSRSSAVMPPGAVSFDRFRRICTACGLCQASCPEKVLVPSGLVGYGLAGFMMPRLDFSRGTCDPACSRCAEACPAQAFVRYWPKERARIRIGVAEWNRELCKTTKGEACTLCRERCPAGAVELVSDPEGTVAHPRVDGRRCIGCGACENYCPSAGKAIRVRPLATQEFAFGEDTLVAYFADGTEWTSRARGVKPLLDVIDGGRERFAGARCYDRVVGRAAAFLYAAIGPAEVFAPVMSAGAVKILAVHGIRPRFVSEVAEIRNRKPDGPCPMDTAVRELGDGEVDGALAAIRATYLRLTGK